MRHLVYLCLLCAACGSGGTTTHRSYPDLKYIVEYAETRASEPALDIASDPLEATHDATQEEWPKVEPEPETAEGVASADVSGCGNDGAPCDDGDLCTVNDACRAGVCTGEPFPCSDDGKPCTDEICEDGSCIHKLRDGYCLIGGMCFAAGQPNPEAECMACDPDKSVDAWTEIPGCIKSCTTHADCHPGGWCGLHFATGKNRCSTPCAGPGECGPGETCTHLPGSAGQGYCQPIPNPAAKDSGASCGTGWDCKGLICLDNQCTNACTKATACPPGATCQAVGSYTTGMNGACSPTIPGLLPVGAPCTKDGKLWDAALCLTGHCDLLKDPSFCAPLCSTDADCPDTQECNIVLRTTMPIPDSIPYHPQYMAKTYDAILGCYTRPSTGSLPVGAMCKSPSECRTNKCMALLPGDQSMRCTTFCVHDSDCPPPMTCVAEAVNLVSYWLQMAGQADSNARTLVRVCR